MVATHEMEPHVEEAVEIILDEAEHRYEESGDIDSRLRRDDLALEDVEIVEDIDFDGCREIDFEDRRIWL